MTIYQQIISEATGVQELERLEKIEETMRHIIFHSTLDWQTKEELMNGAVDALEIVDIMENLTSEEIEKLTMAV